MYWFYFIDALDINHKLQGQAEIIPIFEPGQKEPEDIKAKWVGCNENKPIKFLISAPTMRVPADVSSTCNAYLAFRGIILAGNKTITVRQRSDEGYVFSRVCPSVILSRGGGWVRGAALYSVFSPTPRHVQTWTPLYRVPTPPPAAGHIQTCSPWSRNCQKAGGWHSIEMTSGYF